ncbi:MAG: MCE family protein [Filimonas sp.]|nr:MCE family protein [Filimonas sp.]
MKISNETKIGALTVIAVTLLILGFNFLKGKSLFKTGHFLNAQFTDTKQLMPSNAVFINGFQVGSVYAINAVDKNLHQINVEIKFNDAYVIPDNSIAAINGSPLGASSVEITLGNSANPLPEGGMLKSTEHAGLLSSLSAKVGPVADQLKVTLASLDSVLRNVNTVLDPNTKGNLQSVIANLSKATGSLVVSSASLQKMMNAETGVLAHTLSNVDSFTHNLAANNEKVSGIISNLQETTEHLSKADIDGVVNNLKKSVDQLGTAMNKLNSTDGTAGALLNDKQLYNNLNNTVRSLNILMDDLRVHPKRYVSISVFGKKDKSTPLTAPLPVDTTNTKK